MKTARWLQPGSRSLVRRSTRISPVRVLIGVITAAGLAAGCSTDDTAVEGGAAIAPTSEGQVPMIVDYSPTLSDVPALLFLATHPDVDLLAVTLPGTGESDCELGVHNTMALLVIAGQPDVPVACGPEAPMAGDRDWPLSFREAAGKLEGVVLPAAPERKPVDAIDLLADTLRDADQAVTIVTLGPLTNLGYAFEAEPALAANVRSIVTMGGAFDVPGNVEDSPDAEWNLYIDPESVRVVLGSGVPVTFVPLDATNYVPGHIGILSRLTATEATDSGEAVRQLWTASLDTPRSIASEWWYFWDELAAVVAVDASVATISERSIAMEDSGATVEREDGVPALVASAANRERFEQLFLETFAGGELPPFELNSGEEQYLESLRAAMRGLGTATDRAFAGVEAQAEQEPADRLAAQLVGQVFDAMNTFHDELPGMESSNRMRSQHEAMLAAVAKLRDMEDTYLYALASAAPSEPVGVDGFFEFFFEATEAAGLAGPFEAFDAACGELELAAYGLGAIESICFNE